MGSWCKSPNAQQTVHPPGLLCQLSPPQVLERMENVGTPIESDNDRDRVVRHLEAEGGIQLQQRLAPRALVRGHYEDEGGNIKLHIETP